MFNLLILAAAVVLSPAFQGQAPTYVKGDVVRLTPPTTGDAFPDSRVIAVAGDRIHIDSSAITVNGQSVPNVPPQLLAQFEKPWETVVPAGHYFVIGERSSDKSTVRYHGLIPAANIVRKIGNKPSSGD